MTDKRPGAPLDARDFDAIQTAVMETERGRWFLGEFARRNRGGETKVLLDAIGRLEQTIGAPQPPGREGDGGGTLAAVARSVSRAAAEVTSPGDEHGAAPFASFARAATRMQAAAADIHDAAERVSETAWRLREAGAGGALCNALETAAADISTACAYGGVTSAKAAALAHALAEIAASLSGAPFGPQTLAEPGEEVSLAAPSTGHAPSAPAAAGPPEPNVAHSPERDVEPRPAELVEATGPEPRRMPIASLAAIDALDFRERLKLFT